MTEPEAASGPELAQDSAEPRHRYPGPRPFRDDPVDQHLFYGRSEEVASLKNRVRATRMLLLFGKSGLGKTSLLQAGLFPALRNELGFLPVPVRFNRTNPPLEPDEVAHLIIEDVRAAAAAQGVDCEPGARGSLWEFFKTTDLWHGDTLWVPVLVLDQFEEVFTLQSLSFRRALAAQIGELAGRGFPRAVRERRDAGERSPYSDAAPDLRLILSFREEYLASLEELVADVPALLEHRFRLTPLDSERARDAVERPAAVEDGTVFRTRPFGYDEDTLKAMLAFLSNKAGEVEPFQLQVLCGHVERRVAERQARGEEQVEVDEALLGGEAAMESVLDRFYVDALRRITGRRQRQRARRLCERGLLSPTGKRVSVEEGSLRREYKLDTSTLGALIETRLVRKDTRSGLEGFYYELSHDSLTRPVAQGLKRSKQRRAVLVLCGFALLFVPVFFAWWAERAQVQQIQQSVTSFRDALKDGSRGPEMLVIEPGSFRMGDLSGEGDGNERPVHEVAIPRRFAIGKFEVSFEDYDRFCAARRQAYRDRLEAEKADALRAAGEQGAQRVRQRALADTAKLEAQVRRDLELEMKKDPRGFGAKLLKDPRAFQREVEERVRKRAEEEARRAVEAFHRSFRATANDLLPELMTEPQAVESKIKPIRDGEIRAAVEVLRQRLIDRIGRYPGCAEDGGWGRGQRPVINVRWDDAVAYAEWLSEQTGKRYRLPSEAEWEYAARAGTKTPYWWGEEVGVNRANCDGCGSQWDNKQTAPLGSFAANPWGLNDTAGNVWEWTQDCWHNSYYNAPDDGSAWLEEYERQCLLRVLRGGSWGGLPGGVRSASRGGGAAGYRRGNIGFRLAQDL